MINVNTVIFIPIFLFYPLLKMQFKIYLFVEFLLGSITRSILQTLLKYVPVKHIFCNWEVVYFC